MPIRENDVKDRMTLQYPPQIGDILLCDYPEWSELGDLEKGEMQKRRMVVVLHNRLPYRSGLATVIPLSTSAPRAEVQYQCKVVFEKSPPEPFTGLIKWAKADMLNTVSYERLSLPYDGRCEETSRRKYVKMRLSKDQMRDIRRALCVALGMESLTCHI